MKPGLRGVKLVPKRQGDFMNNSNALQCDVAALPPNVFQEGL